MGAHSKTTSRTLTIFALAMINVAAIGTVKNWPITAEYGLASLFFLLLSALIFFIPVSLVSAELATGWPKIGGVFAWVKEAFGHRTGFLAIWLLWIENVIWYPTVLSFIGGAIAYIFNPALANNSLFMLGVILVVFWGTTLINLLGMRASSLISTFSVIAGAFVPGAIIIFLGLLWYFTGKPLQITFSLKNLVPNMSSPDQWVIFIGILVNLAGMEMSSVHARDVQHPQKNYPKAILLSALLVLGLTLLGVLAIAIVIPQSEISLTAGSLQAFAYFVNAYGLSWMVPFMAILIAIGAIGSMSTWIVGPSKGLLAAAEMGDLPPICRKLNKHGMPISLLVIQGIIVSFLGLLFIVMPTINSAYWIIIVMVGQLYLIMYMLMFAAAIKLRYKRPEVERAYKIPGGNWGMWIISGVGILGCLLSMIIGFFPPSQISTGNYSFYLGFLILGMVITCLAPFIILRFKKPNWVKSSHE